MNLEVHNGYAYKEVFTLKEQDLYKWACKLVTKVPYQIDGNVIRCHELVRAMAIIIGLDYMDGYYGMCEHSWLWTSPLIELSAPPRVLDVYTPGRIPQVQLVDTSRLLPFEYRRGPDRTDINSNMVRTLWELMSKDK